MQGIDCRYITPGQLARGASISKQAVSAAIARCENGGLWRGRKLLTCKVPCDEGSASLKTVIRIDSLPNDLRSVFQSSNLTENTLYKHLINAGLNRASIDIAVKRFGIIQPLSILSGREHHAAIQVASKQNSISTATLYNWLRRYKAQGLAALCPKTRNDKNIRRVLVTKAWDAGIDLSDSCKKGCADQLNQYGRSLIAKSVSYRETQRLSEHRLYELSIDAGSALDHAVLRQICKLHLKWPQQFKDKQRLATYSLDNKQYFDKDRARIGRKPSDNPMDLVWGDVHPVDIWVPGNDGNQLRVRLIAWMDDATHYLWATPHILRKGQGVRQVHIANSLYQMISDPCGGLPQTLYIDNGSEYSRIAYAMAELPQFSATAAKRGIVKAQPYNGPAKGLIEGAFGRIEQGALKHIEGWIGGDRTNKKTHAVGKPIKGFTEGEARLLEVVNECVAIYNDKPQHGLLNGISPRQALQNALDNGWEATDIPEKSFDAVFSQIETRQVRQGKISVHGEDYYCDALLEYGAGTPVEIRLPLRHDARCVQIWKDGKPLDWAYPDTKFAPLDAAGAKEAYRRQKLQKQHIRALAKDIDPNIDPHTEQLKYTDTTPLHAKGQGRVYRSDVEDMENITPAARIARSADQETENGKKIREIIARQKARKEKANGSPR